MGVVYYRATKCTFQAWVQNNFKNPPRKKFFIFQEMELSNSKFKNFFIFFQKILLNFWKWNPAPFKPGIGK